MAHSILRLSRAHSGNEINKQSGNRSSSLHHQAACRNNRAVLLTANAFYIVGAPMVCASSLGNRGNIAASMSMKVSCRGEYAVNAGTA